MTKEKNDTLIITSLLENINFIEGAIPAIAKLMQRNKNLSWLDFFQSITEITLLSWNKIYESHSILPILWTLYNRPDHGELIKNIFEKINTDRNPSYYIDKITNIIIAFNNDSPQQNEEMQKFMKIFINENFLKQILIKPLILKNIYDIYKKYNDWNKTKEYQNIKPQSLIDDIKRLLMNKDTKNLLKLVNKNLVEEVLNLPYFTQNNNANFKLYCNLTKNLVKDQAIIDIINYKKRWDFFTNALDYIFSKEDDLQVSKNFQISLIKLLLEPNITKSLINNINEKVIDQIFNLPFVNENVKKYHKLIVELNKNNPERFKEIMSNISSGEEFKTLSKEILNYINLEVNDTEAINNTLKQLQIASVNLLTPKVISLFVDAINPDIIDQVSPLVSGNAIFNKQKLLNLCTNTLHITSNDTARDATIKINNAVSTLDQNEKINSNYIKEAFAVAVSLLSKNQDEIEKINKSISGDDFQNAIDKIMQSNLPLGMNLKLFDINKKNITAISPKIISQKGLESIAQYLKKPTYYNLFQIFIKTKTLFFAANCCLSFLKNKMIKKEGLIAKKAIALISKSPRGSVGTINAKLPKNINQGSIRQ